MKPRAASPIPTNASDIGSGVSTGMPGVITASLQVIAPKFATCVQVCDSDVVWPRNSPEGSVVTKPSYCREILPDKVVVVATMVDRTYYEKLKISPPAEMVNASGPRTVLRVPSLKVAAPPIAIPAVAQAAAGKQTPTVPAGLIVLVDVSAVILPVSSVTPPIRLIPNVTRVAEALLIAPANTIAVNSLKKDFIGSPRVVVCTFCTLQAEQEACLG